MVGPNGYLADVSRTLICPGKRATDRQRALLAQAQEQVEHNMALLRPGLSFREFAERSWKVPDAVRREPLHDDAARRRLRR